MDWIEGWLKWWAKTCSCQLPAYFSEAWTETSRVVSPAVCFVNGGPSASFKCFMYPSHDLPAFSLRSPTRHFWKSTKREISRSSICIQIKWKMRVCFIWIKNFLRRVTVRPPAYKSPLLLQGWCDICKHIFQRISTKQNTRNHETLHRVTCRLINEKIFLKKNQNTIRRPQCLRA